MQLMLKYRILMLVVYEEKKLPRNIIHYIDAFF